MKFIKVLLGIGLGLLLLFALAAFWGKRWINNNLESVINSGPDRKYNFNFDHVDVDLLKQEIVMFKVEITPLGVQEGVFVKGEVFQVLLNHVNLTKLIFSRALEIQDLSFIRPSFDIHIPKDSPDNQKPGSALQRLFGDILSRGEIRNFKLTEANALFLMGEEQIGSLTNLSILASDLATDSLKLNYPIPFDYQSIHIGIERIEYIMGNGQHFQTGKIEFDTDRQLLNMHSLSLLYPSGLKEASLKEKYQLDLIEFKLDSMILSGIETNSNLHSDLDIRARKLDLHGLLLEDFRNKSLPRPRDEVKPLFQGLLQQVTIPLKLDTLKLINASIVYGESIPGQSEIWKFHFDNLNGDLVKITTIPEFKKVYGHFDGKFEGKIKGSGNLTFNLQIPYDRDEFDMELNLTSFSLPKINEILKPIMNGEIISGDLVRLNLKMKADSLQSSNQFRFDYRDLKVELFQKGTEKKNKFTTTLANIALNTSNLPGEKRYQTANFNTRRNQYRGPFNLIWQSTKEGIIQIVPGGVAKEILNSSAK